MEKRIVFFHDELKGVPFISLQQVRIGSEYMAVFEQLKREGFDILFKNRHCSCEGIVEPCDPGFVAIHLPLEQYANFQIRLKRIAVEKGGSQKAGFNSNFVECPLTPAFLSN